MTLTLDHLLDERRRAFEAVLTEEGLEWKVDDDGDLIFLTNQQMLWVVFDRQDPTFVRVILPRFFELANREEDLNQGYRAINAVANRIKLARVSLSLHPDGKFKAFSAAEILVPDVGMITQNLLLRLITSVQAAAQAYRHELLVAG